MKNRILVIDDEVSICDLLKINLEAEGYEVFTSHNGRDAIHKIETLNPDLLILDLMLPEVDGLDICKKVTSENPIPIIMLTAKTDVVDKVLGLELGADDYITKPFHTREVIARVKALLRRISSSTPASTARKLKNGPLEVIPEKRKVYLAGREIELAAKEYELLYFFMNNLDCVFSREKLLEKVWGYDFAGDTRTIDVHIQRLRKKLKDGGSNKKYIQTVFGVGYRMIRQEADS